MALTKAKGHILADDLALGGNPTTSTQSTGNNTTRLATTAFVQTELSALVDSSPSALNTLNELAAALGDDANFSTTVNASIAAKIPLAGGTMTGTLKTPNLTINDGVQEFDKPSVKGFRFLHNDAGNDLSIQQGDTNNANYVTKFNINSNGLVGIGTTGATVPLTVNNSTDHSDIAIFHAGGGTPNRGLKISTFSNTNSNAGVELDAQHSTGAFKFSTGGTERMRLDDAGKVRIGATLGLNHLLNLQTASSSGLAQMEFRNTAAGTQIGMPANTNALSFFTADAERMRIDSAGSVGIGQIPSASSSYMVALQVGEQANLYGHTDGTGAGSSTYLSNNITHNNGFKYINADSGSQYTQASGGHTWSRFASGSAGAAATEVVVMKIDSSGNVGIGQTAPGRKLHIKDAGQIKLENTTTNGWAGLDIHTSVGTNNYDMYMGMLDGNGRFFIDVNSNGEDLTILQNGNVGIGITNPAETLDVSGTIQTGAGLKVATHPVIGYASFDSGYATRLGSTGTSTLNATQIYAGGSVQATFKGGKLGIGIDTPAHVLSVYKAGDGQTPVRFNTGNNEPLDFYNDSETWKITSGQGIGLKAKSTGMITFMTTDSETERMRIENDGDIRFGIASAGLTAGEVYTFDNQMKGNTLALRTQGGTGMYSIDMLNTTGGTCKHVLIRAGGSATSVGEITSTGNNACQFTSLSDYRLKENVNYTWDATTRLKQLKPARFNWINDEDNTLVDGFMAHEVSSIVPVAVTGIKDAKETKSNCVLLAGGGLFAEDVTEEEWTQGKEIGTYQSDTTWVASKEELTYQQMDPAKLVPLMVKTIQELEARIAILEG